MEKTITIHQAKTHLSRYIKEAEQGITIFIGSFGKKEVQLVPVKKRTVKFGLLKNEIKYKSDADLINSDPDIAELFEESAKKI